MWQCLCSRMRRLPRMAMPGQRRVTALRARVGRQTYRPGVLERTVKLRLPTRSIPALAGMPLAFSYMICIMSPSVAPEACVITRSKHLLFVNAKLNRNLQGILDNRF